MTDGSPACTGAAATWVARLWVAVLVLAPWYAMPSGLPQPADVLMALLAVVVVARSGWRWPSRATPALAALWLFTLLGAVIELGWAIARGYPPFAVRAAYLVFSAVVVMTVVTMATTQRDAFARLTGFGASIALAAQFAIAIVAGRGLAPRATLLFNNPNQLGYWALASCCVVALCARATPLPFAVRVGAALAGIYLAAIAQSKAALLGFAVLGLVIWLPLAVRLRWHAWALPAGAAVVIAGAPGELVPRTLARLRTTGAEADDNLRARGFDRILNYPEYLLIGAGDEEYARWGERPRRERPGQVSRERGLHSSWGTVLFAYGLAGAALCAAVLAGVWWAGGGAVALLLPLGWYGLTHYGLRESLFWVAVAIAVSSPRAGHASLKGQSEGARA